MDKSTIKARFFGAHIGCEVACYDEVKTKGLARGVAPAKNGAMLCYTEYHDNIVVPEFLAHCKLVLRTFPSITLDECRQYVKSISDADDVEEAANLLYKGLRPVTSEVTDATHYRFVDYLRSINICVPFCGHEPVSEGWAILEEKIPANAPKNDFQAWMMGQGYFRADHAWFMPNSGPIATGAHLSEKLDEWKSNAPQTKKEEKI